MTDQVKLDCRGVPSSSRHGLYGHLIPPGTNRGSPTAPRRGSAGQGVPLMQPQQATRRPQLPAAQSPSCCDGPYRTAVTAGPGPEPARRGGRLAGARISGHCWLFRIALFGETLLCFAGVVLGSASEPPARLATASWLDHGGPGPPFQCLPGWSWLDGAGLELVGAESLPPSQFLNVGMGHLDDLVGRKEAGARSLHVACSN